ncbi:MAG TPA: hypothetical protein H9809_07790 [Candidatus Blautia pullicola]|uniref:Uncharacterized protein n=1 Tax=Candidatus Blautia pullicola TaxID=2838498 RepID=A0A9D2JT64_9FIRM|nr:hypothetical protein [Candidatus Blautia pullicola]
MAAARREKGFLSLGKKQQSGDAEDFFWLYKKRRPGDAEDFWGRVRDSSPKMESCSKIVAQVILQIEKYN